MQLKSALTGAILATTTSGVVGVATEKQDNGITGKHSFPNRVARARAPPHNAASSFESGYEKGYIARDGARSDSGPVVVVTDVVTVTLYDNGMDKQHTPSVSPSITEAIPVPSATFGGEEYTTIGCGCSYTSSGLIECPFTGSTAHAGLCASEAVQGSESTTLKASPNDIGITTTDSTATHGANTISTGNTVVPINLLSSAYADPSISTAFAATMTPAPTSTIFVDSGNNKRGNERINCKTNGKGNDVSCNNQWAHTINIKGRDHTWWEPANRVTDDGTVFVIASTMHYEAYAATTADPKPIITRVPRIDAGPGSTSWLTTVVTVPATTITSVDGLGTLTTKTNPALTYTSSYQSTPWVTTVTWTNTAEDVTYTRTETKYPPKTAANFHAAEKRNLTSTLVTLNNTFTAPSSGKSILVTLNETFTAYSVGESTLVTLSETFTSRSRGETTMVTLSETFTANHHVEKRGDQPTATMQVHAGNTAIPGISDVPETAMTYVTFTASSDAGTLLTDSGTPGSPGAHSHPTSHALSTSSTTPSITSVTSSVPTTVFSTTGPSSCASCHCCEINPSAESLPPWRMSGTTKTLDIDGGKHFFGGMMALALLAAAFAYFL